LLDEASVWYLPKHTLNGPRWWQKAKTTIYNAASWAYLQAALMNMAHRMGQKITGVALISSYWRSEKTGWYRSHHCFLIMIEIGVLIWLSGNDASSEITIKRLSIHRMGNHSRGLFEEWGSSWICGDDIYCSRHSKIMRIETFMRWIEIPDGCWSDLGLDLLRDLLRLFLVRAIQAKGNRLEHQKMFESRLFLRGLS